MSRQNSSKLNTRSTRHHSSNPSARSTRHHSSKPSTRSTRLFIDLAMTVLIPMLMAYSLIGKTFHEIAGTVMLLLFLAHHWINRKWWTTLGKGKYTALRLFRTALNLILLALMILQPVSGILISKHLYTSIQIAGITATARELHLACAYWFMVLICLHAGTHMAAPLTKLRRKKRALFTGVSAAAICASLYGIYAFVKRSFPGYMTLQQKFAFIDQSEPKIFFFADYLAIMVLFILLGHIICNLLGKSGQNRDGGR